MKVTISKISDLLSAEVFADADLSQDVSSAFGLSMLSDVLAYVKEQAVLLTGLVNTQVVRTAEMMDMICIVFVRNKRPTGEMIDLAMGHGIVLLSTPLRMYEACGILYSEGLNRQGTGESNTEAACGECHV